MILILEFAGHTFEAKGLDSFAAARDAFEKERDEGNDRWGWNASDMGTRCGVLLSDDGKRVVGRVSYNGRVWDAVGEEVAL